MGKWFIFAFIGDSDHGGRGCGVVDNGLLFLLAARVQFEARSRNAIGHKSMVQLRL